MFMIEPKVLGLGARYVLETELGNRFRLGENWVKFIDTIDEDRVCVAGSRSFRC